MSTPVILPNLTQTNSTSYADIAGLANGTQPVDDTKLKQVIVFGRHSVRSPVAPNSTLNTFSVQPYPVFTAAPPASPAQPPPLGYLTVNGATLETILGGYYRLWLTNEGL